MLKRSLACCSSTSYRHISRALAFHRSNSNAPPDPPPPELCCMSGCANCVWIEYAKELGDYYRDGSQPSQAIDEALKKIEDPSFQAFVKIEIQSILVKNKK